MKFLSTLSALVFVVVLSVAGFAEDAYQLLRSDPAGFMVVAPPSHPSACALLVLAPAKVDAFFCCFFADAGCFTACCDFACCVFAATVRLRPGICRTALRRGVSEGSRRVSDRIGTGELNEFTRTPRSLRLPRVRLPSRSPRPRRW